jgi:hypothetical protein
VWVDYGGTYRRSAKWRCCCCISTPSRTKIKRNRWRSLSELEAIFHKARHKAAGISVNWSLWINSLWFKQRAQIVFSFYFLSSVFLLCFLLLNLLFFYSYFFLILLLLYSYLFFSYTSLHYFTSFSSSLSSIFRSYSPFDVKWNWIHCYWGHYWPIVPTPDNDGWWWVWSNRWNVWQGKPKYSDEACPSAALSTTIPTRPAPGSSPGRGGGKPTTNRPNYGTAQPCSCYKLYTVQREINAET